MTKSLIYQVGLRFHTCVGLGSIELTKGSFNGEIILRCKEFEFFSSVLMWDSLNDCLVIGKELGESESLVTNTFLNLQSLSGQLIYCITGKFCDMKISQIWSIGNFTNFEAAELLIHVQEIFANVQNSRNSQNFMHTNISCYTVCDRHKIAS